MVVSRKSFYVAISVLLLPIFIFILLNTGKPKYQKLPIYGERIPPDGMDIKDTIFHVIPDFSVTNQSGIVITKNDLNDCVYIANFFFASCQDICPKMNAELELIYNKLNSKKLEEKKYSTVKFISFTVDPVNDSVSVLADYAKKFNADSKIWHFCVTSQDSLLKIGSGFLLPVSKEDKTIDHSQQLILVDKNHHIRGVYDGLNKKETERLYDELKVLLTEYDN